MPLFGHSSELKNRGNITGLKGAPPWLALTLPALVPRTAPADRSPAPQRVRLKVSSQPVNQPVSPAQRTPRWGGRQPAHSDQDSTTDHRVGRTHCSQ
ncbi:unnamed protein product [Arctogadus glacialis]